MAVPHSAATSFLLGNLHCPSCVTFIQSLLAESFGQNIISVSPNLVNSVVVVEHLESEVFDLPVDMGKALEKAGFELEGVNTTSPSSTLNGRGWTGYEMESACQVVAAPRGGSSSSWMSWWWRSSTDVDHQRARRAHLANCESCRHADEGDDGSSASVSLQEDDKHPDKVHETSSMNSKSRPTMLNQIVIGDSQDTPNNTRVILSVGGMTCAVCTNGITSELEKRSWVKKVAVNLVGNSATVEVDNQDRATDLVELIEDLGYDAAIDSITELGAAPSSVADARELDIKIEGMFCARCPGRISQAMESKEQVEIIQQPSIDRPFMRLRYTPDPPHLTIRHILNTIQATDPAFIPSIYHPPTLEDRSRAVRARHQRSLTWRLLLTFIIAIPTFVIGIVYMSLLPHSNASKHYLEKPWTSGLSRMDVSLCVLATPVYLFAADIFHVRALKEVRTMWRRGSKTPFLQRFYKFGSMNMLISLGTSIAYLSSVIQMVVAAVDGHKPHGDHFYFDSVVFLTMFLLGGRLIEAYSKSKTGDAVEKLGQLRPRTALLVAEDGQSVKEVPVDHLDSGDAIRVPNGASPPADGIVVSGEGSFDESSLTGEARPVKKIEGDQVFAGTINKGSPVTVRVSGVYGKSMLDQIVEIVREGQTRRAPIEQIADVATTYFVPVITLFAILTFIIWLALALSHAVHYPGDHSTASAVAFAFAFRFAIAVFVVACPCGLALAAPTAIFVGGGLAAKYGILVKGGGEAFEKGSKVDCVVFDKTGTLTVGGEPQVTDFYHHEDKEGISKEKLLTALKALEENSSHPIAKAIVSYCGETGNGQNLENVQELAGMGLQAACDPHSKDSFDIAVGNELLMRNLDIEISTDTADMLESWKSSAKSVALIAIKLNKQSSWAFTAALSISDPIREEAQAVVTQLQTAGISVWMLSGDNLTTARAVASQVGISPENVLAEVLPSEKASKVTYLQQTLPSTSTQRSRATVAMVGDGINDSPALTTADVGIAIGSGSDIAISSADFVLATSNLTSIPTLLSLSRAVLRRVRLNFAWAVVYNMVAVPVAAGALYGVRTKGGEHVVLDPVWAALAMALSSISVVVSSLCLKTRVPWIGFRME